MEKYSVLMSLYKKENPAFFRAALDSMINQTAKPDEIVLVEDGPLTDELYEVVNEYSDCLRIVKNDYNLGLGLALNVGLQACTNELVARMDTDDIAVIDRCEKQVDFLNSNLDVAIVGGQIEEFIDDPHNIIGIRNVPETDKELKMYMKKRCPFNHMTVMFRKTAVIKSGNYQKWFWNEDYYLWIRMALNNFKFSNLPETLVFVRTGNDLYQRRGGKAYFKSELDIQKLMLSRGMISFTRFAVNTIERYILQVLMPNKIRGFVFRTLARKKPE